nr:hypothetical protein [Tanacetum cinerariifolium]
MKLKLVLGVGKSTLLVLLLAAACFYRKISTGGVVVEVVGWLGSSENGRKRVYSVGGKNYALHSVLNVGDRDRGTIKSKIPPILELNIVLDVLKGSYVAELDLISPILELIKEGKNGKEEHPRWECPFHGSSSGIQQKAENFQGPDEIRDQEISPDLKHG